MPIAATTEQESKRYNEERSKGRHNERQGVYRQASKMMEE